jgi:hypothetical protein
MRIFTALLVFFIISIVGYCYCQDTENANVDSAGIRKHAPNLYIQDETWVDISYIKSKVTFVNFVRERTESDIHLIITSHSTASGGWEYTLSFHGQKKFEDLSYVLTYTSSLNTSDDDIREGILKVLKKGLMPYVSRTPLIDYIDILFQEETTHEEVKDRWNQWVFELGIQGYVNGEKSYSHIWYCTEFSVKRITEKHKFTAYGDMDITRDHYEIEDGDDITAISKCYDGSMFYSYSVAEHMSLGGWISYLRDPYYNYEHMVALSPAVEFNIFPYSDYTKQKATFLYFISGRYHDYFEETVYGKMEELCARQTLTVGISATKKWGTIGFYASSLNYLHDFSKNRLSLDGNISLNIIAGLSVSIQGGYSYLRDQLYLEKGDASDEEIYLRLRALETNYQYWISLGVTYTFGSIYSNIVNPRFN